MIRILETIDVSVIVDELDQIPAAAWDETKAWKPATGSSSVREQDRLHVIWQADEDGSNTSWWLSPYWPENAPILTQIGAQFPNTISMLNQVWAEKNETIQRLFFSRLQPGKQIYPHEDSVWGNPELNVRYGLTITTNDQCEITVAGDSANPSPGTIFWFDNYQTHSATNNGDTDRIHLYIDVLRNA